MNNGTSVKRALVCAGAMAFAGCICADTAKIGALVLDGVTGGPIPNAKVEGCFDMDYGWAAFKGNPGPNVDYAVTDASGRCKLSGKTNVGSAGVSVRKAPNGYYPTTHGDGYDYKEKNLFGVWQPDNLVVTIRLQRVENPIPLFVKQVGEVDPLGGSSHRMFSGKATEENIAFDLIKGDWLPPAGQGEQEDIVFTRMPKRSYGEFVGKSGIKGESFRHTMTVCFPGVGNGLVAMPTQPERKLKIRQAPDSGYRSEFEVWYERGKKLHGRLSYDRDRCFCFRIRTKCNDKGEITEAYYGKVYGDIAFSTQEQPEVFFVAAPCMRYYLNPTPLDRNLEWNMVNLCKNPGKLYNPQP